MPRKLQRKLVDIAETSFRLQEVLERWLGNRRIPFETQSWTQGFLRYYVDARDVNCARAVLPALREIARGGRENVG